MGISVKSPISQQQLQTHLEGTFQPQTPSADCIVTKPPWSKRAERVLDTKRRNKSTPSMRSYTELCKQQVPKRSLHPLAGDRDNWEGLGVTNLLSSGGLKCQKGFCSRLGQSSPEPGAGLPPTSPKVALPVELQISSDLQWLQPNLWRCQVKTPLQGLGEGHPAPRGAPQPAPKVVQALHQQAMEQG